MECLRVLVTGGAGFIGSHLVKALLRAGHFVRVLDNFSTGSMDNIVDVARDVEIVVGDVRDYSVVEKCVRGVDVVIHLAALIDVAESIERPDLYFEVNVIGTHNIAKACRGVNVLIFASSSSVYGDPLKIPIPEDHLLSPRSPYAASKVAGEALIQAFSSIYGYRPIILRIFNVYGPKQSRAYAGVVIEFIRRVLRREPPIIYGDGEQTRDFIHISDVIDAIMKAMSIERARGVFNIGSGKAVTINQLAKLILKTLNREDLKPVYAPPRPGDIKHSIADITKSRKILGFEPKISLEEGIKTLINVIANS
uniref:NAD-dependent epimerase/dehydratase family protein n=1 Tax=Ignisphaera aggregans TaxID=334771 RepID=A0A7J2U1Q8_9CREN